MTVEKRLELIKSVGEEVVTEQEMVELLDNQKTFRTYDGFEPSGRVHIAQGILRAINVNKMIEAGARFNMLVADWHGWANNKLGGNLENIQTTGKYLIEIWRLTGMNLKHVNFVWASDFAKNDEYWKYVMQIARNSTLKRIVRTAQIMGRAESDALQASQILYPCMQCADIFWQNIDVTQLGMDQRKVNMLAREVGPKVFNKKPIVVSHHMLLGLSAPQESYTDIEEKIMDLKMSKSNPEAAIFMTDTEKQIKQKIRKAFCPETADNNPILEYARYFIFEKMSTFKIERPSKFGGDIEFPNYNDLEDAYLKKEVHPADLKNGVARCINELVDPVRKEFESNAKLRDLRDQVLSFTVTR